MKHPGHDTAARVALVARASYGRLVAALAARTGDIGAAEDHLSEAFRRALERWPSTGVPDNPEAWLLTVSRNLARDARRAAATRLSMPLDDDITDLASDPVDTSAIPDERLKLMFACAHPAIAEEIRAPLVLQTVLGLDAAAIGAAFRLPGPTMAQRLVRAKKKIAAAGIPFAIPERGEMPARLASVLEAIYAAYSCHWIEGAHGAEGRRGDLPAEALFLAELVATLLPDDPEALGLFALIAFAESRRAARVDARGRYVPLDRQETLLWHPGLGAAARAALARAARRRLPGRFQLEAAIQEVHAARHETGVTDWTAIVALYEGLVAFAPSAGAVTGLAAALGRARGPEQGLAVLARFEAEIGPDFQPFHATRAALRAAVGDPVGATADYARAAALAHDPAVRAFLEERTAEIG